jgi:hypothetical protein
LNKNGGVIIIIMKNVSKLKKKRGKKINKKSDNLFIFTGLGKEM